MATPQRLREQALGLPTEDRAELARDLIRSLDEGADEHADEAWAAEIERRAQQVADGTAELADGKQALERVRAHLRDRRK